MFPATNSEGSPDSTHCHTCSVIPTFRNRRNSTPPHTGRTFSRHSHRVTGATGGRSCTGKAGRGHAENDPGAPAADIPARSANPRPPTPLRVAGSQDEHIGQAHTLDEVIAGVLPGSRHGCSRLPGCRIVKCKDLTDVNALSRLRVDLHVSSQADTPVRYIV